MAKKKSHRCCQNILKCQIWTHCSCYPVTVFGKFISPMIYTLFICETAFNVLVSALGVGGGGIFKQLAIFGLTFITASIIANRVEYHHNSYNVNWRWWHGNGVTTGQKYWLMMTILNTGLKQTATFVATFCFYFL